MQGDRGCRARPGLAPCHACLLLAGNGRKLNARSSWRRICDECSDLFVTNALPVPISRVRYVPEELGIWGQSREIYQQWDTGLGATVAARKYALAAVPAGKVAVVLQDATDANTVDYLLGPLATRPDRPFLLRYCSSIKSFCADDCFSAAHDKSCLAHIKQRKPEPQHPTENKVGARIGSRIGHARRERQKPNEPVPVTAAPVPDTLITGGLFSQISTLLESNGDDDCFGAFALGDIYDLSVSTLPADDSTALFSAPVGECSRPASPTDTVSTLRPTPRESPALLPLARRARRNRDEVGELLNEVSHSLDTLLGGHDDGEVLHGVSWTQSAVDVAFDDALGAAAALNEGGGGARALLAPRGFTAPGRIRPAISVTAPFAGRPPLVKGVNAPISKCSGPTLKAKCVWKQQVVW